MQRRIDIGIRKEVPGGKNVAVTSATHKSSDLTHRSKHLCIVYCIPKIVSIGWQLRVRCNKICTKTFFFFIFFRRLISTDFRAWPVQVFEWSNRLETWVINVKNSFLDACVVSFFFFNFSWQSIDFLQKFMNYPLYIHTHSASKTFTQIHFLTRTTQRSIWNATRNTWLT